MKSGSKQDAPFFDNMLKNNCAMNRTMLSKLAIFPKFIESFSRLSSTLQTYPEIGNANFKCSL